jgi:hypothetical protein
MSDLKPTGVKIKLGNKEYRLRFTINVIDDCQDHFKVPISEIDSKLKDPQDGIKNIKYLLTQMINEDIDCIADETGEKLPHVDERYVGRYIEIGNVNGLIEKIYSTAKESSPEAEDEDPN